MSNITLKKNLFDAIYYYSQYAATGKKWEAVESALNILITAEREDAVNEFIEYESELPFDDDPGTMG